MHTSNFIYHHGEQELHGYLAYNETKGKPRPAVLVGHDWTGRNEFVCERAERLAAMGYVGFAVDMYGHGRLGNTVDEKRALMQPIVEDRHLLRARMQAALKAVMSMDNVDNKRIAAIGFCFGGLCVLDLAREGADIVGVVSFHGVLGKPKDLANHDIKAKVLVLHGYDDPMVRPNQVNEFCEEMTTSNVDWQVHMYGHTQHSFTNPAAQDTVLGTIYNAEADQRSWQSMTDFLHELFL